MLFMSKRTCTYVFVVLSLFLLIGIVQKFSFIQTAFASESINASSYKRTHLTLYEEKSRLAKAISKKYKRIKYKEALHVVNLSYQYADKHELDASLLIALIATESGFNKQAVSTEGASGYTQVHAKYHKNKIKGRNIFDTHVNIEVGSTILMECFQKYENKYRSLACYNGATNKSKATKFYNAVTHNEKEILEILST